jgi:hypothetical protein
VAVGARTAVAVESKQVTIKESEYAPKYRSARFTAALAVGVFAVRRRVGPEQGAYKRKKDIDKERPDGSL